MDDDETAYEKLRHVILGCFPNLDRLAQLAALVGIRLGDFAPTDATRPEKVHKLVEGLRHDGGGRLCALVHEIDAMFQRSEVNDWCARDCPAQRRRRPRPGQVTELAYFDLEHIRTAITTALTDEPSGVVAFFLPYDEPTFLSNLFRWLELERLSKHSMRYTHDLSPERWTPFVRDQTIAQYANQLRRGDALCQVITDKAAAGVAEEYLAAARQQYGHLTRRLVIVFTDRNPAPLPSGVYGLDPPLFTVEQVNNWGWALAQLFLGNPAPVARHITRRIQDVAWNGERFEVPLVYAELNETILAITDDPDGYLAKTQDGRQQWTTGTA